MPSGVKATDATPPTCALDGQQIALEETAQVMPFEAAEVGLAGPGPVFLQQLAGAAQVVLVPGDAGEVHVGDVIGPAEVVVDGRQLVPTLLGELLGFVRFVLPLLCHLFAQPGRLLA